MKDHTLPIHPHTDDDECPDGDPPLEITGSGGIVIHPPEVTNGDRDDDD